MFLTGIIFGSIAVQALSQSQSTDLKDYLYGFYQSFPQKLAFADRNRLTFQGIIDNIVHISGLIWLLGLSIIGAPLILAVIFLHGFSLGFTIGFIITEMKLDGVLVAAASILPHNILFIPALVIAGTTSVSFALVAIKILTGKKKGSILNQFIATSLIILVSCIMLTVAAVIEIHITPIFIQFASRLIT